MELAVLALRGAVAVLVLATLAGGVPRVVALGLAAAAGLWSALAAPALPPADVLVLVAAREVVLGATLGIVAAVPLVAARTAGRLVDHAADPRRGPGPYATLFGLLAAAVFVGIDGHVAFATAIAESHATVPAIAGAQPRILDALGALIASAVRLGIPWLVTAAVVELAVGAGVRVAARAGVHAPAAAAVPAALAMMTAALVGTLAVAIAALVRGTL